MKLILKNKILNFSKYKKLTASLHNKGLKEFNNETKMLNTRPFYIRNENELIIGNQNFFNGSIGVNFYVIIFLECFHLLTSFLVPWWT